MKASFVKRFALIMSIILTLTLAACANGNNNSVNDNEGSSNNENSNTDQQATSYENSWEIDTSPVDLTIFIDSPGRDFQRNWGKDDVSKKWIEETGVNLIWETTPDNSHKKLNLLIASGSLPDMILYTSDYSGKRQLAQNDMIWALDELAEKANVSDFMDHFEAHTLLDKRVSYDSMNIYALPTNHTPKKAMDVEFVGKNMQGVIVLEDIYKEMGSPEIKTGEDYIDLLTKVKNAYPDMIPAQSYRSASPDNDGNPRLIEVLLPHAGLAQKFFKQGDGYVKYWQHPNFIDVLKFANRLYNEGLIDKTEFTDEKTKLKSKVYNGTVFSEINEDSDNLGKINPSLQKVKPGSKYIMIEPFVLTSDAEYAGDSLLGGVGEFEVVISKNSEHAERAIRFLDYLFQEQTQKELIFGLEGRGHTMVDGLPVLTEEYLEEEARVGQNNTLYGNFNYIVFRDNYWSPLARYQKATEEVKQAAKLANKYYKDLSFYTGADIYPPNSEVVKIAAQIKQYYTKEIMKIVTAEPGDVESLYNNMISEMKQFGLEELNEHYTNFFKEKQELIDKYSN